ncbi:unnamed protein product [Cochlearia groenlandica]
MEWLEAQKIKISIDIFDAAKQHLHFLGVVDKNRWLYEGPILERAIYRYNVYWLPLLANYSKTSSTSEGSLVPPLDCEWIWHCHRLNPVRYRSDCEQLYGKILDNYGTVSSTNESGSFKSETENLWKILYPMEPYNIDFDKAIWKPKDISSLEKWVTYDLVAAVKRQSSFYSRVLTTHVDSGSIMEEAISRYKSFIYLIKRNREMSMEIIGVPTCDIDLIWHTHQLNPSSYYNDLEKIFGNILQHDDDVNIVESKGGKKIDNIFSETSVQWEKTFGQKYWKANAEMTKGIEAAEKYGEVARCFMVMDGNKTAKCAMTVHEKSVMEATERKNSVTTKSVGCIVDCVVTAAHKKSAYCDLCVPSKSINYGCGCAYSCMGMAVEKKKGECSVVVA